MTHLKEQTTIDGEIRRCVAASDMYQLLCMSVHLPTEELAAGLCDGSYAEDVATILEELLFPAEEVKKIKSLLAALHAGGHGKDDLLTSMRREYTRLFTHPQNPGIAIYETTFLYDPEDELQSQPTLFISPAALDAERCYKKAGLQMSEKIKEPADHMATEMEFMMYLYLQKARGLQQDLPEEAARREEEIREFSDDHLKKWAIAFFDRCKTSSQNDCYKIIGEIGSLYLKGMLAAS